MLTIAEEAMHATAWSLLWLKVVFDWHTAASRFMFLMSSSLNWSNVLLKFIL